MTGTATPGGAAPSATAAGSDVGGEVVELVAAGALRRRARPRPEPAPGAALVRTAAVGLCGTDLHAFRGRDGRYPAVLGHDLAGVVEAVGAGVDPGWVGRRVTVDPTVSCGHCDACRAGAPNVCRHGGYLGMTTPGALAELLAVEARQLVALPAQVSDRAASVLEPAAVALHLLERVRPLLPEPGPAVVLGAGPMGIAIARVLVARGWEALALEPQAARRAMAERCGLRAAPAAAGEAEAAGLGDAPRLVVETSASEPGVALAEQVATPRSVLALVGRAPRGPAAAALLLGELAAVGVKGGAGHYEEAVRLAAAGAVPTEQLVTHAYPFADAQRAFEETADPARGVVRAVLEGAW